MNQRAFMIVAVATAVVFGSIAAVWVSVNRVEAARQLREAEASKEAAADANRKAEAKKADAEAEKRRAAEESAKATAAKLAAAKLEKETSQVEAQAAEDNRKAKEAEKAKADAQLKAAEAARDEARAKERAARAARDAAEKEAQAAAHKAQAQADAKEAERLRSEKVIAESKLIAQRQIDFEDWQRNLLELQRDLAEREAALKPEKTISDLAWAGGLEDSVMDENGNVKKQERVAYDPETDRELPSTSRALARQERLVREASDKAAARVRENVIGSLEKLYVRALKDDDVVHAQYYRECIRTLYPDWEFKGETGK